MSVDIEFNAEEWAEAAISSIPKGARSTIKPITFNDLWVITKQNEGQEALVRFKPNPMQARFNNTIYGSNRWEYDPVKLARQRRIILKGRQFGFSTDIEAAFFLNTYQNPYRKTLIVAHDKDSTIELFKKVQMFYDNLPPGKRLKTLAASKYEYYWSNKSSMLVGTAGASEFGRSQTPHNVHFSELPSWPESADGLFSGLLEAVPMDGNVFIESTAKVVGDIFHQEWIKAIEGRSQFRAEFYSWVDFDEYKLPADRWDEMIPAGFDPERLDEEELKIRADFGLTLEQLAWRRWKLGSPGGKSFKSEYPLTWQEAFASTGQSYFDMGVLSEIAREIESRLEEVCGFEIIPPTLAKLKKADDWGTLKIFKPPVKGRFYLITCDVAEGLNADGNHDFSVADVWDLSSWEQVAQLHGQWDTHAFGIITTELGYFYGTALIMVERNNHGHATVDVIAHSTQYPLGEEGLLCDEDEKFGWQANVRSKVLSAENLRDCVKDGSIKFNSPETVGEMMTFVMKKGGKLEAIKNCFDDRVTTARIFATVAPKYGRKPIKPVAGGMTKIAAASPIKTFKPRVSYGLGDMR